MHTILRLYKATGKRSVTKARRRWEDNIRTGLREMGWKCVEWIRLPQDRDQ
jgi:hypothetical protein